jgi:hypothetical protein
VGGIDVPGMEHHEGLLLEVTTDSDVIGATLGASLEEILKPALAFAISIPIGALALRLLYLNRLSPEDKEFRRAALGKRTAERVFLAIAAVIGGALASADTIGGAPFWALVVAFAVMLPSVVATYARWSLKLRQEDRERWRLMYEGKVRPPMRIGLYIFLSAIPAGLFLVFIVRS